MPYILALDEGTTSARAIVFETMAAFGPSPRRNSRSISPSPAGSSTTPRRSGPRRSASPSRPSAEPGLRPKDVAAVGITNQRETTVVWDRATGEPIANAIVWQDRRTAAFCDRLRRDGHEQADPRARPAWCIDAYFSGSKVAWMLDNVPGRAAQAEAGELAFGTIDTWLVWKLTGGKLHVTDVEQRLAHDALRHPHAATGTTSCSSCFDIPRVAAAGGALVQRSLRRRSHVARPRRRCRIAGIAGDQQAALFGQMCLDARA